MWVSINCKFLQANVSITIDTLLITITIFLKSKLSAIGLQFCTIPVKMEAPKSTTLSNGTTVTFVTVLALLDVYLTGPETASFVITSANTHLSHNNQRNQTQP